MDHIKIINKLKSMANSKATEGMARYGINVENALGISMPFIRKMAKKIGRNHELAGHLWNSGIHEARILACLVDNPRKVTTEQMEDWVGDFDSWDLCDQCCGNLFDRTPLAYEKALEWSEREEEFIKRAGFALMAWLAVHDKKADDAPFVEFLPVIVREAGDERNFVKKAVNWALRQIGKRNRRLNCLAIETAVKIKDIDSKAARWIAVDALRELTSDKTINRLKS